MISEYCRSHPPSSVRRVTGSRSPSSRATTLEFRDIHNVRNVHPATALRDADPGRDSGHPAGAQTTPEHTPVRKDRVFLKEVEGVSSKKGYLSVLSTLKRPHAAAKKM